MEVVTDILKEFRLVSPARKEGNQINEEEKMAGKNLSIETRLYRAESVVRNAWDHEIIREAVSRYKYGDDRMKEGLDLSDEAVRLYHHQVNAVAAKLQATIGFHEKMGKLKGVYG